jgi:hypothetical protein
VPSETFRVVICGRCRVQLLLCSRYDRGRRFCQGCGPAAAAGFARARWGRSLLARPSTAAAGQVVTPVPARRAILLPVGGGWKQSTTEQHEGLPWSRHTPISAGLSMKEIPVLRTRYIALTGDHVRGVRNVVRKTSVCDSEPGYDFMSIRRALFTEAPMLLPPAGSTATLRCRDRSGVAPRGLSCQTVA